MDKTSILENLCSQMNPQRHIISILYVSRFGELSNFTSTSCQAWERDLNTQISSTEWESTFMYAHKGSLNVSTQECVYKILTQWYITPTLLNQFYPKSPISAGDVEMRKAPWFIYVGRAQWSSHSGIWSTTLLALSRWKKWTLHQHSIFCTTAKPLENDILNLYLCLWQALQDIVYHTTGVQQISPSKGNSTIESTTLKK